MNPLHSMLSYSSDLGAVLPVLFLVLTAAAIALGFVYGYKKGAVKVSWGGLVWLFAGGIFSVCAAALSGTSLFGLDGKFEADFVQFITIFSFALFLIGLGLVAYGLCNRYYRPELRKEEKTDDEDEEVELFGEPTFEFSEDITAPQFNDYVATKEETEDEAVGALKETEAPITKKSRVVGGVIFGATLGLVAFLVYSCIILFINATSLNATGLGAMFDCALGATMLKAAQACALEFLTIGVIVGFACLGWKIGFIKSLRVMLITVGFTAVFVLSFGLPFTRFGREGFLLGSFVRRLDGAVDLVGPRFSAILSRLMAGTILFLLSGGVMAVVCVLLHKLVKKYKKPLKNRTLDSVLACVAFAIVGVLTVGVIWCVIYTFQHFGVIGVGSVTSDKSLLSNAMLNGLGAYLGRFWDCFVRAF